MRRAITILLAAILMLSVAILMLSVAMAEEYDMFVICAPGSYVNIRSSPSKGGDEAGRLDCGDSVTTDGKERNGYIHVLGMTDYGDGCVYKGYLVPDRPRIGTCKASIAASGRVACYQYANGKRTGWIKNGADLKVYVISDEWAVTNKGFVRCRHLEVWP